MEGNLTAAAFRGKSLPEGRDLERRFHGPSIQDVTCRTALPAPDL